MIKRQSGATLIELLISIVILSILLLSVLGAFRAFVQTNNKLIERQEVNDTVRIVSNLLREIVSGAISTASLNDEESISFIGKSNEMNFVTLMRRASVQGLYTVRISNNLENKLIISFTTFGVSESQRINFDNIVLSKDAVVTFMYRDDEGEWSDIWENNFSLPNWVSIHINYKGRHWPKILIKLNA